METCGLNSFVVYFNGKTHDTWEGKVTIRVRLKLRKYVWDTREGVTLRRLILWGLECALNQSSSPAHGNCVCELTNPKNYKLMCSQF
jgi:hypothetical protein